MPNIEKLTIVSLILTSGGALRFVLPQKVRQNVILVSHLAALVVHASALQAGDQIKEVVVLQHVGRNLNDIAQPSMRLPATRLLQTANLVGQRSASYWFLD